MKEKYNPLGLGNIKDSVGYIPAGAHNPEIYYTLDGEQTAAITLLTFLLMKKEVTEHLVAGGVTVIASSAHNEQSEAILQNLRKNFPVGTIREGIYIAEKDAKFTLGIAYSNSSIIRINGDSGIGHRNTQAQGMAKLFKMFSSFADEDETDDTPPNINVPEEDLIAEEDSLYSENNTGNDAIFKVSEILSAINSPEQLAKIMARVQCLSDRHPMKKIPSTVCHEVAHTYVIDRHVIVNGFIENPTDAIPDFKIEDYKFLDGRKVPDILLETLIKKTIIRASNTDLMQLEIDTAKPTAPKNLSYFLSDVEEAKAELLGTALLEDIESVHLIKVWKSQLKDYMPKTYGLFQKYLGQLKCPTFSNADFVIQNISPDEKMGGYATHQLENSYDLK